MPVPSRSNWDFSEVRTSELLDCCVHEYKREIRVCSPTECAGSAAPPWEKYSSGRFLRGFSSWDGRDEGPVVVGICEPELPKVRQTYVRGVSAGPCFLYANVANGEVAVTLLLRYAKSTNGEILQCLSKALPAIRSELASRNDVFICPRLGGRAKESDLRARLRSLGIMRLRHALPLAAMFELLSGHQYAKIFGRSPNPTIVAAKVQEERKSALRHYRRLCPSALPENEYPRNWKEYVLE